MLRVFLIIILFLTSPVQASRQSLQELKKQLPALKGKGVCQTVEDCRLAGLGQKHCGGPQKYLIYSKVDAQEKELLEVLQKIKEIQIELNKTSGMMGICVVAKKPQLECRKNRCLGMANK